LNGRSTRFVIRERAKYGKKEGGKKRKAGIGPRKKE